MTLDIAIVGLSITSSWGNGHATTYRSLVKGLAERGHRIVFYERDRPWYAAHRDMPTCAHAEVSLYRSPFELFAREGRRLRGADVVILGSYVPDGVAIAQWLVRGARGIVAFYDIDTPVTLAGLRAGAVDYLSASLAPAFDLYLSFTGGPTLGRLEDEFGVRRARALYCAVDPDLHRPEQLPQSWDLGYLGTYSADRQQTLRALLLEVAAQRPDRRFAIAGAQYPDAASWPRNVQWLPHVPPDEHAGFFAAQRFTLNVTRAHMLQAGWSPSVRLFEAAACGAPVVSDDWPGLDQLFAPGEEILIAREARDMLDILTDVSEERRRGIAAAARRRVLAAHTGAARARELESYIAEAREGQRRTAGVYA